MSEFLKGNFKTKHTVVANDQSEGDVPNDAGREISEKLRKAALASIGGSMVYMERTDLTWNGDDK